MPFSFKIIDKKDINSIIPLIQKLTNNPNSDSLLEECFSLMVNENYECAGVFENEKLIGICGMWFQTMHYCGKSTEVDHVYIEDSFQGKG